MAAKTGATRARKHLSMFKNAKAFSSFSIDDIDEAREFYSDTLGVDVSEQEEGLELNLGGGHIVFLYSKPNHTPASFTVLNFPVNNIEEAIDELTARGIRLERYDSPDLKTDDRGIMRGQDMQIAWFKDPAGNILSVIEEG
jgi:catechol 2,3-dioxygenase-like lactoylglutathione lyase family enzyme